MVGLIRTDKSYGKLAYVYTGATGNSWADTETSPEQAAINGTRINKLLAEPTEFVYSDYCDYSGTLRSLSVGYYWSTPQSTQPLSLAAYTSILMVPHAISAPRTATTKAAPL